MANNPKYYIIESSALPEVFLKVAEAKRLLDTGEAATVNDATRQSGISRSAFYKYRDSILPFQNLMAGRIITFQLTLHDETGQSVLPANHFCPMGRKYTHHQPNHSHQWLCWGDHLCRYQSLANLSGGASAVSQCHARRGPGGDSGRLTPQRYMLLYGSSWRLLGAAMLLSVSGFAGFFPGIRSPGHTAA